MKKPTVAAQLNAQNLQVEGSEWTTAKLEMRANPSEFAVQSGSLVNAQQGQATFSASVGLRNWSYEDSNRIEAHLDAQQHSDRRPAAAGESALPDLRRFSAKVSPGRFATQPRGSGSAQITNASAYNEPIQNFAAKFNAANGSIVSTLNLAVAAGAVDANLSYTPKTKAYKVRLNAPSVVLQKLQTVKAKDLPLTGT